MELIGEKIILRPATMAEVETFTRWMNDPEVTRHLGPIHGKNITLEEEGEWLAGVLSDPDEILFSIFTRKANKLIGNCGVHLNAKREDGYAGLAFLGLAIGEKDEWGKGYGTEVIQLLLQYLYEKGCGEVYLTVDEGNVIAQAVYKKCGFEVLEKTSRVGGGEEYVMRFTFNV